MLPHADSGALLDSLLRTFRKVLSLFLLWPPLPGDLLVPKPDCLACWMRRTVLSLMPTILAMSF
ncbi:Hypothetical protein FKW44_020793 [Caligus rogercresseyi]|uniref:Uncharacterized protein n=1 Tax=Caligus rogercresseyi TaxID=217165 RepID=A0A7T8GQK7_CALRO|nr:Hypothetical protein FKW44_020793 [Caligus rogercresseyi]